MQRLLVRYIALQAKLAEVMGDKPAFDDQTGKRLIALALAEWDGGREHALLWLTAHVELLQRTIENRMADDQDAEAWLKLQQQWAAAIDERNTVIARYELMTAKLLDQEVVRH